MSDFLPVLEGPAQGHLIGILQGGAHGDAVGDPGGPDAGRFEQAGNVEGSCLAFNGWVGGQDDLFNLVGFLEPSKELLELDVLGASILHGGDGPVEDMVETPVVVDAFHGSQVPGCFNQADPGPVPAAGRADLTGIILCQVAADGTEPDGLAGFTDGFGQGHGLFARLIQDMEGQALSRLLADAGQFGQGIDQLGHGG